MVKPLGIYRVIDTDDYVVGAELGGMFMTSEVLSPDDVEDMIIGNMDLSDYHLTDERDKAITQFEEVPYEKWAEIAGTELAEPSEAVGSESK